MMQESRSLKQKETLLKELFSEMRSVVVALSAGVDSSLTLAVAHDVLKEKAVAAVAISPSLSQDNVKLARRVAKLIGAELIEIETHEVEDPEYQKNNPLRCYFCKHIVYSELKKIAEQKHAFLVDGFNTDDTAETRPGMRAAKEERVRHPLFEAGLTKKDVRSLAGKYGLPNWNKAADACLSSRFLTGIPVNPRLVKRIEGLESVVRRILQLGAEHTLRVRHLGDQEARVEVNSELFPIPVRLEKKVKNVVESFGYREISFAVYRWGSASG
ncbi:ATP-dependent sacrificial sulfur transferase LarE [Candidatus Collierbacteria bacterium]|nr:ATP-dependent sacrificial sulfur transferase LarE [Candidatus Collierbacteria bacterium]